jgi:aminoglycoside phosphotransferase family enzyme/predicted kinase
MDAPCELPVNMGNDVERMVDALRDPACYPHSVSRVDLLQTHISWIFLAGDYVYKIKKPVNLGFLDFTSLAARRHYCDEELRLNRRLAPTLYLGTVAITGNHAAPRVSGDGQAIEYAVKMRRFPQNALLDAALARGEIGIPAIIALARNIAEFHAAAPSAAAMPRLDATASLLEPALDNFAQMLPLLDTPQDIEVLAGLRAWTLREHQRPAGLARERLAAGRVRECHGDLHLGNIALIDGAATPFDCLEFNQALRWIDVISEAAFLAMDLEVHGRRDLAYVFLNAYLEHSGDYGGVAMLPFYLVYRAVIRAKINLIRACQQGATREQVERAREAYHRYIAYAVSTASAGRGSIVITHGLSGSGKTTLTQLIVPGLGAVRVRSDVERKRMHGLSALAHTGSARGAGIYAADATARVYDRLAQHARSIAKAGFPVLVDATFLGRDQRAAFLALARELGVPFTIVNFAESHEALRARIVARAAHNGDASEATLLVLEDQIANHQPLSPDELEFAITVDAGGNIAESAAALCAGLTHRLQLRPVYG